MMNTDVCIAGGGVPGLTLALLLARGGLRVTVVEPGWVGAAETRTAALMQGSIATLRSLNVWDECVTGGGAMRALRIIDDSRSHWLEATFTSDEIGLTEFGVNMPQSVLLPVLRERVCSQKNITLLSDVSVAGFLVEGAHANVRLDDKRTIMSRLVIGADGRHSTVREAAEISFRQTDYMQRALTLLLRHSRSHDNTSIEFHRNGGPFTLVPLAGKRSSLVWVDSIENINQILRLSKPALHQAVQDRTQNLLGEIEIEAGPQSWGLEALQAERLVATRCALVAEAAHVLHPLGAQGLNLSLRDVAQLASIIIDAAQLGLDIGSDAVLTRYERQRRQDIGLRVGSIEGLHNLVRTKSPIVARLRRLGFRAIANTEILRLAAMRHGIAA